VSGPSRKGLSGECVGGWDVETGTSWSRASSRRCSTILPYLDRPTPVRGYSSSRAVLTDEGFATGRDRRNLRSRIAGARAGAASTIRRPGTGGAHARRAPASPELDVPFHPDLLQERGVVTDHEQRTVVSA